MTSQQFRIIDRRKHLRPEQTFGMALKVVESRPFEIQSRHPNGKWTTLPGFWYETRALANSELRLVKEKYG